MALRVDGVDQVKDEGFEAFTDIAILEDYYQNQIQYNIVDVLNGGGEEFASKQASPSKFYSEASGR